MIGQSISHYKSLDKLGEGGMGVVYKAQDTKLERTVALKFLAAHLLNDEEAKQRFLREAKAAAALHHPSICPVHEIDDAGGKTFISMAFIEGESLEDRISNGPLALKDAIDIGRQITEGLEAAHDKGVVHRDIKPANVMVDAKGRATVMDFGLARLSEASRLTKGDQTVGTAAYMSPEQLQGEEVDHRADIWAVGCVLYEMVAGARAFKGEYQQALAYEIVSQEPEPLTGVRSGVPMELEFIVGKCLAKDAADRYQHANEIAVDLRTLSEKLKSGRSTIVTRAGELSTSVERTRIDAPVLPEQPSAREGGGTQRERLAWAAAVAVLAVVATALAITHFGQSAPELETARFLIEPPDGVRFGLHAAEISPDGRQLAFIGVSGGGAPQLWVRSLASVEARPLRGTEGAALPFWSPDSRFLGFFADGKLKKVDIAGGPAQTLCDAASGIGGTWAQGPNGGGVIVFAPATLGGLERVSDAGGEPTAVTVLDESSGENTHRFPHFLPDGRNFFYTGRGRGEYGVYAGSLDGGSAEGMESREPILRANTPVRYAPPAPGRPNGYLLFARENSLMAQELDAESLELAGQPFPVAEGVVAGIAIANASDFSVSQTGTLIYRARDGGGLFQLEWFDRNGERLGAVGQPGRHNALSLSPDDLRVAVTVISDDTPVNLDIWIQDLARGVASRLTFSPALEISHIWSPDGKRIAFSSNRDGGAFDLYLKPTSGAGDTELLLRTESNNGPRSWSADGMSILYVEQRLSGSWDLWVLPLEGERKPVPYLQTEFNEVLGQFSPDGRWVAYASDESGRYEIYVQPYPADGGKWQVSANGGSQPRWRGDGNELFYLAPDNMIMAAEIEAGETLRPGVPSALFSAEGINYSLGGSRYFHYAVSNDGRRFLIDKVSEEGEQAPVTVVLNWQAELGRR